MEEGGGKTSKKRGRGEKKVLAAFYFPTTEVVVSSTLGGLTAVFGMGTGVSLSPWPPEHFLNQKDSKTNWESKKEKDRIPVFIKKKKEEK